MSEVPAPSWTEFRGATVLRAARATEMNDGRTYPSEPTARSSGCSSISTLSLRRASSRKTRPCAANPSLCRRRRFSIVERAEEQPRPPLALLAVGLVALWNFERCQAAVFRVDAAAVPGCDPRPIDKAIGVNRNFERMAGFKHLRCPSSGIRRPPTLVTSADV
jgi:hypothetical protein